MYGKSKRCAASGSLFSLSMADTEDDPGNGENWTTEVAVQLVEGGADVGEGWPHDAAGEKNKRGPTVRGQAVVHAALAGLSAQISDVVAAVGQQLDAVDDAAGGPDKLRAETVELTFGVTFRAGAGKIVEAVLTAGGESSAQIKLVLSRGHADGGR
jgi:hypothetical protein